MLRVRRRGAIPPVLESDEARQARLAIIDYLRMTEAEREQRRAPINDRLFRSGPVVHALRTLFRDKCAFCEVAIRHGEEQVEHFRPLHFATGLDGAESREHYVWLAYEWENLLLSCKSCSQAKKSMFPVAGGRAPIRATLDEVRAAESPLLLDPSREDPWIEIRLTADGLCRPHRRKGEVSIAVLQLNRSTLVDRRREDLDELRRRFAVVVRQGDPETLDLLFDLAREHIGARLDVLHRTLVAWTPPGTRVPGNRVSLPAWFRNKVAEASDEERARMAECLVTVFEDDARLPPPPRGDVTDLAGGGMGASPPIVAFRSGRQFPDREIKAIDIYDFKGISRLSLTFPRAAERRYELPSLMLLGENAAGKSSVLEAAALALAGRSAAARLRIPPSEFLRRDDPAGFDIIDPPPPRVVVHFRDDGKAAEFGVTADGRRFTGSSGAALLVLAYGARRQFSDRSRPTREPFGLIRNLFVPDRPIPAPGPWLREIRRDEAMFNAVARALREVLAVDARDELVMDEAGRLSVRVLGRAIPVERLSQGYRSLFSLAVDMMRNLLAYWPDLERARAVVIIDEIETHLHPRWKMRIVSALRRAFPGVQFIISTHDPLSLRGMDDGEVHVIERDAADVVHLLGDLPPISGMSAEQILTSEYFGLFSTADAELEWELARAADPDTLGRPRRSPDDALIAGIVLGDTIKQQLVHEAVDRYLIEREQRRGQVRARREAVDAVLEVLRAGSDRVIE
jgi:uncharacterized protein (TIGR02646 family)